MYITNLNRRSQEKIGILRNKCKSYDSGLFKTALYVQNILAFAWYRKRWVHGGFFENSQKLQGHKYKILEKTLKLTFFKS